MLKTLWNTLLCRTRYYYFTITVRDTTNGIATHTYAIESHIRLDKCPDIVIAEVFGIPTALTGSLQLANITLTGEYWV